MAEQRLTKPWSSNQTFMALNEGINILDTVNELVLLDMTRSSYTSNFANRVVAGTSDMIAYIKVPLIPDNMQESYSPNIVKKEVFGLVHPLSFYSGGGEKKISFSIDIHDDVKGVYGNVYAFVDKLKQMVTPVDGTDGTIQPPSVYIQLGTQFAGKGHIEISVQYKKPFVNGRYKMATIGISFTFHELMDNSDTYILNELDTTTIEDSYGSGLTVDESALPYGVSITDFYQKNIVDDYFIGQYDVVKQKLAQLWQVSVNDNIVYTMDYRSGYDDFPIVTAGGAKLSPDDAGFYDNLAAWYLTPNTSNEERKEYNEFLLSIGYHYVDPTDGLEGGHFDNGFSTDNIHPYVVELMVVLRSYYHTISMLGSMSYRDAVNNMRNLLKEIDILVSKFLIPPPRFIKAHKQAIGRDPYESEMLGVYRADYGWPDVDSSYTRSDYYYEFQFMNNTSKRAFKDILGGFLICEMRPGYGTEICIMNTGLKTLIQRYIDNFSIFAGVGE